MQTFRRALTLPVASFAVLFSCVAACGNGKAHGGSATSPAGGSSGANDGRPPPASGQCPDITSPEAVMRADFSQVFGINAEAALQLRAGTAAALELTAFSKRLDGELSTACTQIAKDLGAAGDPKDGTEACNLAIKSINDTKAKLGAKAQYTLVVRAPVCAIAPQSLASCASECDPKVAKDAKIDCEKGVVAGDCPGKCDGTCDAKAPAKCDGECTGSCDGAVRGVCAGTCKGKCGGKSTGAGASCADRCDGKCDGVMKGDCRGKC